mgnify:CR=1 FL=1
MVLHGLRTEGQGLESVFMQIFLLQERLKIGEVMSKVYTTWTEATNNASKAMMGLISCIESGRNAWIEVRKNGEQSYPIKIKNPALENPFNWEMNYGIPRNEKDLHNYNYFNETERDLTYNWIACFGEKKAIEEYQNNGIISKELFNGIGICHPVRIKDANFYRKNILGDNYEYGYWTTYWKPKNNIPYWVVDESIGNVFTICFNDEIVDKAEAVRKSAQFMMKYANKI